MIQTLKHYFAFGLTLSVGLTAIQGCSSSKQVPVAQIDENTIAVYGSESLSLSDFEREYSRTTGGAEAAAQDSLAQLEDFLDRYVNFRLKVNAAREAGIHKDPEIISEIRNYQNQFARPFLLEKEVIEPLVADLYDKQAFMVEASHILIRIAVGASPEDSTAAYQKMMAIVDSLESGSDFGDLAFAYSEDPSASNEGRGLGYRGYLGYFSGGKMVQDFEEQAFGTPVGGTSPVFRTQYGYHILRVSDKKPAIAPIQLSHLMLMNDSTTTEADAVALLASIRDSVADGFDFVDFVQRYSADEWSRERNGDIGMQSFDDRLLPALKDPAFELENIGDVSEPIVTQFGYHLVQLTARGALPTFEESYDDLKARALKLPRARAKEIEFGQDVLAKLGATYDTTAVLSFFDGAHADSLEQFFRSAPFDSVQRATNVVNMGDSTYTFGHIVSTSGARRYAPTTSTSAFVEDVVSQFMTDKAIDYEVSLLEGQNPDFKATMNDFRDGLVLFKFMEDSVWTAAANDSTMLRTMYDESPDTYAFPQRTQLISIHSQSRDHLAALLGELRSGTMYENLDPILTTTPAGPVRVDTINVAGMTDSVFDTALLLSDGDYTEPLEYNRGFIIIKNNGTLAARTKTYDEAQSDLISEYQTILEDRIVTRLRSKYGVRTFPAKLHMAFSNADDMMSVESSENGQ